MPRIYRHQKGQRLWMECHEDVSISLILSSSTWPSNTCWAAGLFIEMAFVFIDHVRANSETSHEEYEPLHLDDRSDIVLSWLHCTRAHQQPLTSLVIQSGIIVTGSQVTIGHNKHHGQE